MSEKFKNKYSIKSSRLPGYNYSQSGMYFVTICTQGKEYFFGEVIDGEMILSEIGKVAQQCWQEIPKHFPFVSLDEFVVMPDHVHGIVEICHGVSSDSSCVTTRRDEALPRLYNGQHEQMSKISPKRGSLSVIIGSFKSIVSKTVNRNISNIGFHWQPRFYDHIIRDEKSLNKIREYIRMNPKMWEIDKNKVENIFM